MTRGATLCFHARAPEMRRTVILETAAQHRSRGRQSGNLAWHGGQIIQASGRGPDAAKPQTDNRLGMVLDLSKRRGGPDATEQGVLCAQ